MTTTTTTTTMPERTFAERHVWVFVPLCWYLWLRLAMKGACG